MIRRLVGCVLCCLLLASTGCGSAPVSGVRSTVSEDGGGVIEQIPAADRTPLPAVRGQLLDGSPFDSGTLAGNVIVYNIWGSWCSPCRSEAPVLRRVARETSARGVRFVGINVRDNDASARAFERNYRIEYPSITTEDSTKVLLAFGSQLPRSAVPSTLIVDREGRVAARVIGETSYSTLTALVTDVLLEGS